MAKLVKCLYCEKQFDRDQEAYVYLEQKRRYMHQSCFEEYQEKMNVIQKIHEKMQEILGAAYAKVKIDRQISALLKEGKTETGILQALIYWYDIKEGDPTQAGGGIGIVPYIYSEAEQYWINKHRQENLFKDIGDIEEYTNFGERKIVTHRQRIKKPLNTMYFILE